jgi:natural product precursor
MNKLKLNRLSDKQLAEKQMNRVLGGGAEPSCYCCCGCQGPSSSDDNRSANNTQGKWSKGCGVIKDGYIIN